MPARSNFEFEKATELPSSTRSLSEGGTRRSPYDALVEACKAEPEQWFVLHCDKTNTAYSRGAALRKRGLKAHVRGVDVYVTLNGA